MEREGRGRGRGGFGAGRSCRGIGRSRGRGGRGFNQDRWEPNPDHNQGESSIQGSETSMWDHIPEPNEILQEEEMEMEKTQEEQKPEKSADEEGEFPDAPKDTMECFRCGSKDHLVNACPRAVCEHCGRVGHEAAECYTKSLSEYVAPLCAAQVEGQSFFNIPDCPSDITLKERLTTAVIVVVTGSVTAEQIEQEFKGHMGANVWRWIARPIDEKSFIMRFPSAKMIKDCSHFNLVMRTTDALISVRPWSPGIGAKGELQSAWFRVKGIPYDKRSAKTLAYVGSLVGVTLEVDERSLTKIDYVRMRIACKDVTRVPHVAEGVIVPYVYDFLFEREVVTPPQPPMATTTVPASNTEVQPTPKRPRTDIPPTTQGRSVPAQIPAKMSGEACAPPKLRMEETNEKGSFTGNLKVNSGKKQEDVKGKEKVKEKDDEKVDVSWDPNEDDILYDEEVEEVVPHINNTKNGRVRCTSVTLDKDMIKDMGAQAKTSSYEKAKVVEIEQVGEIEDRLSHREEVRPNERHIIPVTRQSGRVQEKMYRQLEDGNGQASRKRSAEALYKEEMQQNIRAVAD